MTRALLRSAAFIRAARKVVKRHPPSAAALREALVSLQADAFHPQLRTHKLKGQLEGSWACSVAYDLRIVFRFVPHEDTEAILLETVGTHEEVY